MIVLLVSPSGSFNAAMESLKVRENADTVILVGALASDANIETAEHILLGEKALAPQNRILRTLEGSVIGRNLKRILPTDGARRFAARARHDHRFRVAVKRADLIVALERDAALASWSGLRRWAQPHARGVYGLAPARALLTSRRNDSAESL